MRERFGSIVPVEVAPGVPATPVIGYRTGGEQIAGEDHARSRAHLAWGAGPHTCPASSLGCLIAECAIDQLLDVLPDMRLAVPAEELRWRPGPLHRTLAALPIVFPPAPLLSIA